MIWAEVPVDAGDNSNRPPGWRIADVDLKDRWCYDSKVDPDEKTADKEREEQEKLDDEVEEMLEEVSKKQTSFLSTSGLCSSVTLAETIVFHKSLHIPLRLVPLFD